jgi:hypothetical protein
MSALRRTCREVTRLVLEGQDRRLSATERVALRLHWLACDGCSRFRRQVEVMRGALGRWRQYREGDENEPG